MKKQATTTSSPISKSVMDQIKSGKVHMKPRAYYWLLSLVTISAVVLAGITMTYLSSIVFFWLRVVTADTMAYGARANLNDAIASFPWWALIAAAILLYVAVSLVRKQGRMYKHKTSSIVAVIVAGAGLPALAGTGETANYYGCKGHWSGTASWGRCVNTTKGITIRLQTACSAQSDYAGPWRSISKGSTVDPIDAYDCRFSVQNVTLGFK